MSESYSVEAILSVYDKGYTSGMEKAAALARGLDSQNQNSGMSAIKMGGAFGVASALVGKGMSLIQDSVGGAVNRFDTLNKYPVVMKALGYSAQDVSKSTKALSNGIDGLPTSLDEITSSAQQLAPLTGSANKAAKSAIALNNAFLASGASVADTSRGLQQYTQMLSTGKVDMMSWRTLMETMPIALRKVANSFGYTGKSAETDLYDALKSGKISVEELNDAFIKLNKGQGGFADLAKKNSAGIGTSFANLKSSVVKNLGNMIAAINNGFSKAGFGSIAQQLDNLKYAINGTFAVITPIVTTTTSIILTDLKSLFNFVKSNKDWLMPLTIGIVGGVASFKTLNKAIDMTKIAWNGAKLVFNTGEALIGIAKGSSSAGSALTFLAKESKVAAAAQAALNVVAEANPYVLIATAIIAVGAALTYWFTQTESGKQAWASLCQVATQAWNAFYPAIKPAIDGIVQAWNILVQAFKGAWSALQPVFQALGTALHSAFDSLAPIFQALMPVIQAVGTLLGGFFLSQLTAVIYGISALIQIGALILGTAVSAISGTFAGIAQIIQSVFGGVVGLIQGIWTMIKGVFDVFGGILSGDTGQIWNGIKEIAAGAWRAIISPVQAIWGTVKGIFNAGRGAIKAAVNFSLHGAGSAIMNSFLSGLQSAWGAVKGFVSGIAGWIKAHKGPISYDRRLLIPAGNAIMDGLNSGLTSSFADVQATVSSIAGAIADGMSVQAQPQFNLNGLNQLSSLGRREFSENYDGSMKLQESSLQMQNNALLRKIAGKESNLYLDGKTLVGGTLSTTNEMLGNQMTLKGRWN